MSQALAQQFDSGALTQDTSLKCFFKINFLVCLMIMLPPPPLNPPWELEGNLKETKSLYFIFATRKVSLVTGLRPSQPHLRILPGGASESVVFAPAASAHLGRSSKGTSRPPVLPSQAPHDEWTDPWVTCVHMKV